MKTSSDFAQDVDRLQAATGDLADLLAGVRQAATGQQLALVESSLGSVEEAADRYVEASSRVGNAIAGAAEGLVGDAADEDAVARISASIGLDLKVAEELAAHAILVEPEDPQGPESGVRLAVRAVGGQATSAIEAAPLRSVLDSTIADIRGQGRADAGLPTLAPGSAAGSPGPVSVATPVETILKAGGGAITASAAAVIAPNAQNIGDLIKRLWDAAPGDAAKDVVDKLNRLLHALARAAAKVLDLVISKVKQIIGSRALDEVLKKATNWLTSEWNNLTSGGGLAIAAVNNLVDGSSLVKLCDAKLQTLPPDGAQSLVQSCDGIAAAHTKSSGYVGWANKALSFGAGTAVGKMPQGLVFLSLVALALIGCSIWLAQDYLDAQRLGFLPDHVKGIRRTVM